jgi:hypothetical protein
MEDGGRADFPPRRLEAHGRSVLGGLVPGGRLGPGTGSNRLDSRYNIRIGAAAAQVAAHLLADVVVSGPAAFLEERCRGHNLAGCAVAALKAVVIQERLLHGMQFAAPSEPLDGGDGPALQRGGQSEASEHPAAIHVNRAGAALPMIATLFRAREAEMLAQGIEQGHTRIETQPNRRSIDLAADLDAGGNGDEIIRAR